MNFIWVEKHLKYADAIKDTNERIEYLKSVISRLQEEMNCVQNEAREWCIAWEELHDAMNDHDIKIQYKITAEKMVDVWYNIVKKYIPENDYVNKSDYIENCLVEFTEYLSKNVEYKVVKSEPTKNV